MSNYNQLNEESSQNPPVQNQESQDPIILNNPNPLVEIEMQNKSKKVNPRDYLPDPRIQKKKAALSLQAQKQLVELKNKREIEMAILKRIIFRIFIFFVYMAVLVLGFIGINLYLAFIKSSVTLSMPNNLHLEMSDCQLSIYDDNTLADDEIKLSFNIPGSFDFWLGETSFLEARTNTDADSGYVTYIYTVKNVLTIESCQISLYIGSASINNLLVQCNEDYTCVIVSYSQNLTISNMTTVKGADIYMNMLTLNTSALEFIGTSGLLQLNHFNISQDSSVNLTSGNIILQSTDDYVINWTSGVPSYCVSAPVVTTEDVTGCETGLYNFKLIYEFF